jgi:hypothetical protein
MPGLATGWLDTAVPSTVVSAPGNTAALGSPYNAQVFAVIANVTAYTSGTATFEVQWSYDGTNFWSADQTGQSSVAKDTFAGLAAVGTLFKIVTVKAPYYRITWTTGSYTMNVQVAPVSTYSPQTPEGFTESAPGSIGSVPVIGAVGATTLSALYVQATPATYSAIVAVPLVQAIPAPSGVVAYVPPSRISFKVNCTANSWTVTPQLELLWSLTGLAGSTWHGDPADLFATQASTFNVIKEVPVRAPYFAFAVTVGTPGSMTFTVDYCVTAV